MKQKKCQVNFIFIALLSMVGVQLQLKLREICHFHSRRYEFKQKRFIYIKEFI